MSPEDKYAEDRVDHGRVIFVPPGHGCYIFPLLPGDVDVDHGRPQ